MPESSTAKEIYRKLDASTREVRILDILPFTKSQDEPLRCRLRHVSLSTDATPSYESISYCWGDPDPCSTIILDDKPFPVPKNTYLALLRASYPDHERTVWIDAVCINQQDLQERSQQVNMMGAIYSQTTCGLVYLGEEDDGSVKAMQSLEGLAKEAMATFTRGELREMTIPERKPWAIDKAEFRAGFDLDALVKFFGCAWFRRLWILQEAVLPSHSTCFYGASEISLDVLLDATVWLSHHFPYFGVALQLSKGREAARRIWNLRTMKSRTGVFAELMTSTGETLTSDPRDRVFGLLGMIDIPGQMPDLLRSDYAKGVGEVIRDGVRYCVEVERYPFIWSGLSLRSEEELEDPSWPSWVPRMNRPWSDTEDAVEFPHHEDEIEQQDALQTHRASTYPKDPTILRISGVVLDKIAKITDVLFVMPQTIESLHAGMENILNITRTPPKDDFALHRTLSADLDYRRLRQTRPQPEIQLDFLAFLGWTLGQHVSDVDYKSLTPYSEDVGVRSSRYYLAVDGACPNRRFCVLEGGGYGLVPQVCGVGDVVVRVGWVRKPVALRPTGEGCYRLLGECYVDGCTWPEEIEGVVKGKEEVVFEIR